jgi:hypothetical protein
MASDVCQAQPSDLGGEPKEMEMEPAPVPRVPSRNRICDASLTAVLTAALIFSCPAFRLLWKARMAASCLRYTTRG